MNKKFKNVLIILILFITVCLIIIAFKSRNKYPYISNDGKIHYNIDIPEDEKNILKESNDTQTINQVPMQNSNIDTVKDNNGNQIKYYVPSNYTKSEYSNESKKKYRSNNYGGVVVQLSNNYGSISAFKNTILLLAKIEESEGSINVNVVEQNMIINGKNFVKLSFSYTSQSEYTTLTSESVIEYYLYEIDKYEIFIVSTSDSSKVSNDEIITFLNIVD